MSLQPLTPLQKRVLDFIRAELGAGRLAPTYRELAHLTCTAGDAFRVVTALEEKGYITRSKERRNRSIRLTPDAETYTVRLSPEVNVRLAAHTAAWASTPEAVISQAVAEYLGRHP
ncbi:LexA family protein [Methylobacterium flocculans]|uniref:LexA family protein n=1 Tax=Methylobacterium flocculans TaxID=2984843 RepID=UPI0021F38F4D|nr:hypothetical protein [Methylobacterium sp. FF17]